MLNTGGLGDLGFVVFLGGCFSFGFFWCRMTDVVIISFIDKLVKSPENVCTWRQKGARQAPKHWN